MKLHVTISALLSLFLVSCSSDDGPSTEDEFYPATLKQGASLDDAETCSVDGPACPDGLQCAYIDLETDESGAYCVDLVEICEMLECESGECAVMESYPVQIACFSDGGDGGDDPSCTVSSDGEICSDDADPDGDDSPSSSGSGDEPGCDGVAEGPPDSPDPCACGDHAPPSNGGDESP